MASAVQLYKVVSTKYCIPQIPTNNQALVLSTAPLTFINHGNYESKREQDSIQGGPNQSIFHDICLSAVSHKLKS